MILCIAAAIAVFLIITILSGNRIYAVQSGSMEPEIHVGAAAFVDTHLSLFDVREGDVVCYYAANGKPVIHRAVAVTDTGVETKGDANEQSDGAIVTGNDLIGRVYLNIPLMGYVMGFISSPRIKIILITALAVIVLLILFDILRKKPPADNNQNREEV